MPTAATYTDWSFGSLPELMEVGQGKHSMVGFPALIDAGDRVRIEVFDEPDVAAAKHRAGLRRLFALQLKDALKYLEKNIPDLTKMAVAYMQVGTAARSKSCAPRSSKSHLTARFCRSRCRPTRPRSSAAWKKAVRG